MAMRANWKGFLKVGEVTCPVALHTAVSTSNRVAFHMVSRPTGHRLRRQFVDAETGDPVGAEDQVKGYETAPDEYIVLEPEEIAAAIPESDKTLDVIGFVPRAGFDETFRDRPYYLAPTDRRSAETYSLLRDTMRDKGVAAIARAVLFRRLRTVLVEPSGDGLLATTLHYDYEVRSPREAFDEIPDLRIEGEMLDLARHIIDTKMGTFDPASFHDRYEAALAELVKAKLEGRPTPARKPAKKPTSGADLLAALRDSAGVRAEPARRAKPVAKKRPAAAKRPAARAAPRRKTG